MRGSPPSGAMTRPPLMLCTRLVRFGSAMTRPIRLTARCAGCGAICSVRTSSRRWVGFGTNTCPSGSRRGESTAARTFAAGGVRCRRHGRARSRTEGRGRRPPAAPSRRPAGNSAAAGNRRRTSASAADVSASSTICQSGETSDVSQVRSARSWTRPASPRSRPAARVSVPASRSSPGSPVIENTSSIGPAVRNRGDVRR